MFWVNLQMAQLGKKHQFTVEIWSWNHLEKLEKRSEATSNGDKYKAQHCAPSRATWDGRSLGGRAGGSRAGGSRAGGSSCAEAERCHSKPNQPPRPHEWKPSLTEAQRSFLSAPAQGIATEAGEKSSEWLRGGNKNNQQSKIAWSRGFGGVGLAFF